MLEISTASSRPSTPARRTRCARCRASTSTIDEGSFVIVIGTNGSGKSTLLNAVAGSFLVDAGTIALDGRDITRWPEHRRASLDRPRVPEPVQRHGADRCRSPRTWRWRRGAAGARGLGWALGAVDARRVPRPRAPAQHAASKIGSTTRSAASRAASARR